MSRCTDDDHTRYRVTGEVADVDGHHIGQNTKIAGAGDKFARVRCAECGGKVGYIGSDVLNLLGVPDESIKAGACLGEKARVLEVDLI